MLIQDEIIPISSIAAGVSPLLPQRPLCQGKGWDRGARFGARLLQQLLLSVKPGWSSCRLTSLLQGLASILEGWLCSHLA